MAEHSEENERLREALIEGVLAARALGTPVCEDGFRHCCGGPRSGCRDSCANRFLREWAKRHAALSGSPDPVTEGRNPQARFQASERNLDPVSGSSGGEG